MASIVEELIDVLEETTGCYENLLTMASNKTDVIIKGDMPSLQSLTEEEQSVAGRLLRLEKKRQSVVADICLVTNKNVETMTVSNLIDILPKDMPEHQQLEVVAAALVEIVNKVKVVNDVNQQLLQESLEFVNFTINAIQSSSVQSTGNSYEKKGQRSECDNNQNFFDAKQ